jgi:hypothetical protein
VRRALVGLSVGVLTAGCGGAHGPGKAFAHISPARGAHVATAPSAHASPAPAAHASPAPAARASPAPAAHASPAPAAHASPAPAAIAQAQATHEYPSPPPPPQTAAGGTPSPAQAVSAFASQYINWTAETVAARMRTLAAQTVGQARSAMTLTAAETATDYELRQGGIANHGTVEAVAPLPRHRYQYIVVTLESTTATNTTAYQGLLPAWHVALATVTELSPGRWVLSAWQPEN